MTMINVTDVIFDFSYYISITYFLSFYYNNPDRSKIHKNNYV